MGKHQGGMYRQGELHTLIAARRAGLVLRRVDGGGCASLLDTADCILHSRRRDHGETDQARYAFEDDT